ncbi:MAG: ABC transporter substrate-binding protein [Tissierellaceae bacterium]|nr:ABC transporter substrate-binding protein [Tissierellaceae bacterium]
MKKGIISKLMALGMAGSLLLTGCSSDNTKANASSNKDYTIGIVQLAEHPALDDARKGFEDGLKELGVSAEVVYQNAQGDIPNTVSISQKYVNDEVDLIYAIATPAAQSAKQVSDGIPVLFSAVTDPVEAEIVADWDNVGGNVTGTSDMAPTAEQLKMFKELDPSIETIGVLYNTSEANSKVQLEEVQRLAPEIGLEVKAVGVNNINDIAQAIDSLLSKVDALYGLSDNLVASSIELVSNKLIENNMISICAEESQVGGGLLITNGLSYYELGKQTAQMAKEILVDGVSVSDIPVGTAEKTIVTVNEDTMKALNLDENLPLLKEAVKVGK